MVNPALCRSRRQLLRFLRLCAHFVFACDITTRCDLPPIDTVSACWHCAITPQPRLDVDQYETNQVIYHDDLLSSPARQARYWPSDPRVTPSCAIVAISLSTHRRHRVSLVSQLRGSPHHPRFALVERLATTQSSGVVASGEESKF